MSNKNNKNPNINKLFNKLYISFPNITTIDKTNDLINFDGIKEIKYVYVNKDSKKWFIKTQNNKLEIFLFGKIKNEIPQPPLLNLTFDKVSSFSKNSSGIINAKQIYINIQYFIDNYPNFKTKLNEITIDVFINNTVNSINVMKLGEYTENNNEFIENLNILIDELDNYESIKKTENTQKDIRTCEICGKKLKKEKTTICKKCSKKRHAANLLIKLIKYVEPETQFMKKDLKQIYNTKMAIDDCIWSLEDYNLIKRNNNEYRLVSKEKIDKFINKYAVLSQQPQEEVKKEEPKKLNKKCSICKKTLSTSKFYKSKKTKDGLEDYCKNCKKYVNAANYLKDLTTEVSPGSEFKVTNLTNDFENPLELIGRLWELQDFDLLTYDDERDIYNLKDLDTCQNFLDKYYISGSVTIKPEIKNEIEKELTKEEQMNIIIESIKNGKTEKEAAEIAGINLYNITHWFNEGKNNSGKENIEFYNLYTKAKKEAKINSMQNFYVIESFNHKTDLTIADTLRKQQMENVLKELGSGSSMKTAAFNSSITYETLQYWYKRGKQNFGEEYNEFYEKINIIQGPIGVPKPEDENKNQTKEIHNDTSKQEEKLPDRYKHILDPLPHKFKNIFRGAKESESGFAWVRKERNSWRYERQQKDKHQSISKQNIYELFIEVRKQGCVWGVRDLKKAKKTLKQNNLPEHKNENNYQFQDDDIFKDILNPITPEYAKRFRKPSSSGLAWVNKINNTWSYANPKDNMRIYDSNIYNLYLKIKEKNLPWGVRDLQKAKESLAQCDKPTTTTEIPKKVNQISSKITYAIFTNDKITKTIINGKINDNEVMDVISNFKEYEEKLIRIITTRHSKFTELFMEFNLEKNDLDKFKELIKKSNENFIRN